MTGAWPITRPFASPLGTGGGLGLADVGIVGWGDSLTEQGDTNLLQKTYIRAAASRLNTLRIPNNEGIAGQTSPMIVARAGGLALTVTVSGNSIPASGGVAVTAKNINVLYRAGVFTGTILGSIAGVPGTMSTDASGNWTFTRTASGSVTAVPAGSVFTLDKAVAFKNYNMWLQAGRNDVPDFVTIKANIAAQIAYIGHLNYRVLSVLPSANDGPSVITAIQAGNADLAATYGSRFVDTITPLQAANDGSANDLADVAAGYTPRSLRKSGDPLHLEGRGYEIMGIAVANSYPASDRVIDLGLAAAWGNLSSSSGWTVGNGWSFTNSRLVRDTSAASEVMRASVPEITIGQNYRAVVRGYFGAVNVRNGGQFLTLTAANGLAYIDFTATAQNFGFQAGGAAMEILSASLFQL